MQMNYKKSGQFEKLYPITLGDNVKLNAGKTLEEWKKEVDGLLNDVEDGYTEIWSGNEVLGVGSSITLPSTLSSAKNGWILVFEPVDSDSNKNYCYIPRIHPSAPKIGIKFVVGGEGGTVYSKFVIIIENTLNGHSTNGKNGNENMALKRVIKY